MNGHKKPHSSWSERVKILATEMSQSDRPEGAQGFGLGFSGDGRMDVDETHSAFVGVDARVRDDRDVRSRSSRSSRDQDSFVRSVVSSSFVRFRLTTDGCRVI